MTALQQHGPGDGASCVLRFLSEVDGAAVAVVREDALGDRDDQAGDAERGEPAGRRVDRLRIEQRGDRTLDVDQAEHGEQGERGHFDDQERAGDPGVGADVQACRRRRDRRDDDGGGHRVESGDRDAEVVGDAQCEHGDDERQRDEADEEDGDTGGRSEGPAHQ